MAERAAARYIPLQCGHHAPSEVKLIFGLLGDGRVMCERCGEFQPVRQEKGKQNYPDQPMF